MQEIKTDEKTGILYRESTVFGPKAIVVLVHGLCAHSGRWEFLAEALAAVSVKSYAIELQGFGETTQLKGYISSFSYYFKDIIRLISLAREEHPNRKVFLCGQSMGGLLTFVMASITPSVADGIICLSPAFKNMIPFSSFEKFKIIASLLYNRRKQFPVPFTAQMCTRDEGYQKILDNDNKAPRRATSQMLLNILIQQLCAHSVKGKLSLPVLFQLAGNDSMVDSKVSKEIFKELSIEDKTVIEYPEHVHALSYDCDRNLVFDDIINWIFRRI
ncbi:alpha/beta fold hydrolase [Candidatus Omnitrophota bacterium]